MDEFLYKNFYAIQLSVTGLALAMILAQCVNDVNKANNKSLELKENFKKLHHDFLDKETVDKKVAKIKKRI